MWTVPSPPPQTAHHWVFLDSTSSRIPAWKISTDRTCVAGPLYTSHVPTAVQSSMETSSTAPAAVPTTTRPISSDRAMLSRPEPNSTFRGFCSDRGVSSNKSYRQTVPLNAPSYVATHSLPSSSIRSAVTTALPIPARRPASTRLPSSISSRHARAPPSLPADTTESPRIATASVPPPSNSPNNMVLALGLPPIAAWTASADAMISPLDRSTTWTEPRADPNAARGHRLQSSRRIQSSSVNLTELWHLAPTHLPLTSSAWLLNSVLLAFSAAKKDFSSRELLSSPPELSPRSPPSSKSPPSLPSGGDADMACGNISQRRRRPRNVREASVLPCNFLPKRSPALGGRNDTMPGKGADGGDAIRRRRRRRRVGEEGVGWRKRGR
mmetsp:Transcript_9117/g.19338  ORF Transcript_9117/g.19338 Transcript_9117/m.19338 type:complete len:382 (-) Transcript_9117:164-1309(-)